MYKFFLIILSIIIICPSSYAFKSYSYDENGTRVYQTITAEDMKPLSNKLENKVGVYDANGNRVGKYKPLNNGSVGVYDSNGNRVGK